MTAREELLALADRVEQATGADTNATRLLGREALLACGKGYVSPLYAWLNPVLSLDAAMSLVPENPWNTGERFQVESWTTNGVHAEHVRASAWVSGTRRVFAATPALALTAAALRARASTGDAS